MSLSPFSTATRSKAVFLDSLSECSSQTVHPSIKSSLHLPVFFTWQTSALPSISTLAINLFGLDRNLPLCILSYLIIRSFYSYYSHYTTNMFDYKYLNHAFLALLICGSIRKGKNISQNLLTLFVKYVIVLSIGYITIIIY